MSDILTFKISIPNEDGFVGRECNNPDCKRYFKIHQESFKEDMYCPYCGELFNKNELWTQDQLGFAKAKAIEESTAYIMGKADEIFKNAFINTKNVTYKSSGTYQKKYVAPPVEKKMDIEIECSNCNAKFQVYGTFGYCPCCKYDNILIYDTNIAILFQEINSTLDKNRALRHAYNDLVSTFEDFCKKKNRTGKSYNFQNLDIAADFFKSVFSKDIFAKISNSENGTIKRFFQKRHVYQHNHGIIDQKYISIVPSDTALLNTTAILNLNELKDATVVIRKMLLNVI
jgi:hypothetical protein